MSNDKVDSLNGDESQEFIVEEEEEVRRVLVSHPVPTRPSNNFNRRNFDQEYLYDYEDLISRRDINRQEIGENSSDENISSTSEGEDEAEEEEGSNVRITAPSSGLTSISATVTPTTVLEEEQEGNSNSDRNWSRSHPHQIIQRPYQPRRYPRSLLPQLEPPFDHQEDSMSNTTGTTTTNMSLTLSDRNPDHHSTASLLDSMERRTQRTYRYGIGLVCVGATLNWLGFAQGHGYVDPLRYLGVACVISGSFCVCLAMCRWLGRPISVSSHRVTGLGRMDYQDDRGGRPNDVHVINVNVPMYVPSMHEEYRPTKPPDYDMAVEGQPPPYDEAIKLSPGALFTSKNPRAESNSDTFFACGHPSPSHSHSLLTVTHPASFITPQPQEHGSSARARSDSDTTTTTTTTEISSNLHPQLHGRNDGSSPFLPDTLVVVVDASEPTSANIHSSLTSYNSNGGGGGNRINSCSMRKSASGDQPPPYTREYTPSPRRTVLNHSSNSNGTDTSNQNYYQATADSNMGDNNSHFFNVSNSNNDSAYSSNSINSSVQNSQSRNQTSNNNHNHNSDSSTIAPIHSYHNNSGGNLNNILTVDNNTSSSSSSSNNSNFNSHSSHNDSRGISMSANTSTNSCSGSSSFSSESLRSQTSNPHDIAKSEGTSSDTINFNLSSSISLNNNNNNNSNSNYSESVNP